MSEFSRTALVRRLELLGQIGNAETALFQQQAAALLGIGVAELKAIDLLTREGPKTVDQLAAALRMNAGDVAALVDRLGRRGLAGWASDRADPQCLMVEADLDQLMTGPNAFEGIGRAFADFHDTLSTEHLMFLIEYQERAIELTRAAGERLRDGGRVPATTQVPATR